MTPGNYTQSAECPVNSQAGILRQWRWLLGLLLLIGFSSGLAEVSLELSPEVSTDGVASLTWSGAPGAQWVLQESRGVAFAKPRTLYRGEDLGSTLTGLSNGVYFYRIAPVPVATASPEWSEPVRLEVAHHSLGKAFAYFSLGVLVFASTVLLIVGGVRQQRRGG